MRYIGQTAPSYSFEFEQVTDVADKSPLEYAQKINEMIVE